VSAKPLRVLVCDDELQILRGLRIVLREAGFDVVVAQSAQAALDAGADDYVTKPFNPRELIARLNAVLRRVASTTDEPTIRVDGLEIDLVARTVRRDGQDVHLTPIEHDLLRILARNRGRLLTHRTLLSEVWGPQYADDTQVLRTHIANLRRKLEPRGEPHYIRTDARVGYRFIA
jgi:two-component system KDP operon response regulator KdpE